MPACDDVMSTLLVRRKHVHHAQAGCAGAAQPVLSQERGHQGQHQRGALVWLTTASHGTERLGWQPWDMDVTGYPLLMMAIEVVVYFVVLLIIEKVDSQDLRHGRIAQHMRCDAGAGHS